VSFLLMCIFNTVTGGVNVHYNRLFVCPLYRWGVQCVSFHCLGRFPWNCVVIPDLHFFTWVLFRGVLQCGGLEGLK
jgi:hypothetical protein